MEGTGFLKTVRVGGFDKKDVLAYVDDLNTKIYTLEAELDEKKALLESSGGGAGVDTSKYDELLAADKAKISELMTSNDSLKIQLKSVEDEMAEKDKELEELKKQNSALEEQLQEAKNKAASAGPVDSSAMDLSNVFIEAQKTANSIVTQAKDNARKMDEDAKKLANQVVDDANGKASTIIKSADDKASRILTDAEDKSAEMRAAASNIKTVIATEISEIETNVHKLTEVLQLFSNESLSKLSEAKNVIDKAQESINKGIVPSTDKKVFNKPAPAPAPAPKPAPQATQAAQAAPQQAPQAAPVQPAVPKRPEPPKQPANTNKFGFDMSELENLTKAAEAAANSGNENYGNNLNAGNIKLSDM